MSEPMNYRYIDTSAIVSLAQYLRIPFDQSTTTEGGVAAGTPFFRGEGKRSRTVGPMGANDPRLLSAVVEGLRDRGYLHAFRPTAIEFLRSDTIGWYVHESNIQSTPVYIPLKGPSDTETIPGLDALNLWVSDPLTYFADENDRPDSYLVMAQELNFELHDPPRYISGWSALRYLADRLPNNGPLFWLEFQTSENEQANPENLEHPIDRLKKLPGSIVQDRRRIETLYRIRHVTEGRTIMREGKRVPVEEVLAYPLYIAE
jgi:hypothetical protein